LLHARRQRAFDEDDVAWSQVLQYGLSSVFSRVRDHDLLGRQARFARGLCNAPGPVPARDQQVCDLAGPAADQLMALVFEIAELEHIAQHCHLATAFQRSERFERRLSRSGAGRVRIVQNQAATQSGQRIEPARHALEAGQPAHDFVQIDVLCQADCRRGQRCQHLVAAEQGDLHFALPRRGVQRETHPFA